MELKTPSGRVRFHKTGDHRGPLALFLPGAAWTGLEGLFLGEMMPGFDWHLVDLPGTGGSDPLPSTDTFTFGRWFQDLSQALGGGPFHLVGHSLGGYLGLLGAVSQPQPVASLVLIDGGIGALPRFPYHEIGFLGGFGPLGSLADRLLGGRLIQKHPGPPGGQPLYDPESFSRYLGIVPSKSILEAAADRPDSGEDWAMDSRAILRLGLLAYRLRPESLRARLKFPTLAIVAAFPGGRPDQKARARRTLSRVRNQPQIQPWMAETGHYPFWEAPQAFEKRLREFYGRPSPV